MIRGIAPDQVRYRQDFGSEVYQAGVIDARFSVVCLAITVTHPLPDEYLLRPVTLVGCLETRWSLFRQATPQFGDGLMVMEIATADRFTYQQLVSRELIADPLAWQAYQSHVKHGFLVAYQNRLDQLEEESGGDHV